MTQIDNLNLFIGVKEEYALAESRKMKIVCALNRSSGFITHQSVVGWCGRGCNKDNPYYLYKETENAIFLNMIDGDNPDYVNDEMINASLNFINRHIESSSIFIYCSLGESRSPSIALMYMLEYGLISKENAIKNFRSNFYSQYAPKRGNLEYIKRRWLYHEKF
ncbi:MAG: dual specificity protein phosphatase family protein [Spirochaetes bacterium]|nr:dual specificity protein phosphatase family protein [Spirochaetota bacterium]MBN2769700.1 dual specificity protein phosphatase family protein [Spirochaetota bacterium]